MRSPPERFLPACLLALTLAVGPVSGAESAGAQPAASAPVSVDSVRAIVAELRKDPDFAGRRTERQLQWIHDDSPTPPTDSTIPGWMVALVRWLSDAARWSAWLLGAIAVALLLVFAWRLARIRAESGKGRAPPLPSHVNELDIRPESLPADIGATALGLLGQGDQRGALSLLYRGALSRLVHFHRVPIRAASTEGESLRLAGRALPAEGAAYFQRLVRAWQTEVYADRRVGTVAITALCNGFDDGLGGAAPRLADPVAAAAVARGAGP